MEHQAFASLIRTAHTFSCESLELRHLIYKQEILHKGYVDMVKAYNKIVFLKRELVKSFKIEWRNNLPFYKFTMTLTEAAELVKQIEKAQKDYDEMPKFRVNVKTITTIEAV